MGEGKLRLLISEQGPGALLVRSRWWTVTPYEKLLDILPKHPHQQPRIQREKTMPKIAKTPKVAKAPAKVAPIEATVPKRPRGRPRKVVDETTTMPVVQAKAAPGKAPAKAPAKAAPAKAPPVKAKTRKQPKPGSKFETIYKMLIKPNGCTRSEMLAKIGWQAISMQQAARNVGLELRQEKSMTGKTRYYGNSLR